MNFKEIINSMFTGIKKGEKRYDISLFSNMITLQDKSKYSKENQIKIENYIKEYKDLLNRSVIMTPEFNNDDLNKEIKMIFSLTTNIFVSEKDKLFEEKSEIKKLIISNKYKLYISDIERLISDIELRLVALRDIKLNSKFLGRKSRTLEQEIEDLSRSYITCTMQKIVIKDEVDIYMTLLQNTDFKDIDIEQLKKYYINLKEQSSKILSKDEINGIDENGYDIYDQIANIEKKCEEYFFNHPKYINNLISILETLENNLNKWRIGYNRNNFNNRIIGNFTRRINELEKIFAFYEKYGKK